MNELSILNRRVYAEIHLFKNAIKNNNYNKNNNDVSTLVAWGHESSPSQTATIADENVPDVHMFTDEVVF